MDGVAVRGRERGDVWVVNAHSDQGGESGYHRHCISMVETQDAWWERDGGVWWEREWRW